MVSTAPPRTDTLFALSALPDASLDELHQRIFLFDGQWERLLKYLAALQWFGEHGVSRVGLALRRSLLLYGPPGCGKTSTAKALANASVRQHGTTGWLCEINAHAIPQGTKGGTQKQVEKLITSVKEIASLGVPIFFVCDEVESIAMDRGNINSETDSLDTLYGVNAFIEGLDHLVEETTNVIVLMTSNLPRFIDRAVLDRTDFHEEFGLPDASYRRQIFADTLTEFSQLIPIEQAGETDWETLVTATEGLSPRELRHLVKVGFVLAMEPGRPPTGMGLTHVIEAAGMRSGRQQRLEATKGVYSHGYQRRRRR